MERQGLMGLLAPLLEQRRRRLSEAQSSFNALQMQGMQQRPVIDVTPQGGTIGDLLGGIGDALKGYGKFRQARALNRLPTSGLY